MRVRKSVRVWSGCGPARHAACSGPPYSQVELRGQLGVPGLSSLRLPPALAFWSFLLDGDFRCRELPAIGGSVPAALQQTPESQGCGPGTRVPLSGSERPLRRQAGPDPVVAIAFSFVRSAFVVLKQSTGFGVHQGVRPARLNSRHLAHFFPNAFMKKAFDNKDVSGATPDVFAATRAAKRKPIRSFREGDASVSIWAREYNARTFHSCTFERSYKDSSGQRKYTSSFGLDDLGHLVTVAQRASEYLRGAEHEAAIN